MVRQVVDTETAKEFMNQILAVVDAEELSRICDDVQSKAQWFRDHLGREALAALTDDDYQAILRRVFSARGTTRQALLALGAARVAPWIDDLLHGSGPIEHRFDAFVARFEGIAENVRIDIASELLHFTNPEEHWLWTRWMWDPRTKTGALPLVTSAAYDFDGDSPGQVYLKVGRAIAFVHEVGDAAGYQKISDRIFGTDVFLSCVYVVYTYTVLKMRMTQEFNKVIPELPEFSRRLLGVHRRNAA